MICNDNHQIYVWEIEKAINNSNSIHDVFLNLNDYFISLREKKLLPPKMYEHCALRKLEQKVKDYCSTIDFFRREESRESAKYFSFSRLYKLIEEEFPENSELIDACERKANEVMEKFHELKNKNQKK